VRDFSGSASSRGSAFENRASSALLKITDTLPLRFAQVGEGRRKTTLTEFKLNQPRRLSRTYFGPGELQLQWRKSARKLAVAALETCI
jgi:hypothetical protein